MSYKINQVAQKIGVKPQIIRYYEHEGMLSNISRNPNGYRSYSEEDISYIRFLESVKKLKRSGLPLIDLREYAKLINSENKGCTVEKKALEDEYEKINTYIENLVEAKEYIKKKLKK